MNTTRTLRAVGVYAGRKALNMIALVVGVIFALLIVGIWLLAYHFSAWWWILLLPILPIGLALFLLYMLVRFLLMRVYPAQFTKEQSAALQQFLDKLMNLNDVRSTTPFMLTMTTLWELTRYRNARTLRKTIDNSKTLKPDFERLNQFF